GPRRSPTSDRTSRCLAQPRDDTVDVRLEQVRTHEMATRLLMGLVGDPGRVQRGTELALTGEHLPFGDHVDDVEEIGTVPGDQEDPLVAVTFDAFHRVVGADPGLVPQRHAVHRAAAELGHGGRRVDVMPYEPALAAKTGRARVRTDRREMAVVLRRVLERAETTHGESRHGATVVLGVGPEVGVD